MQKGISSYLIIIPVIILIFIAFGFFYIMQNRNLSSLINQSQNLNYSGVLDYGGLLSPRRDYCDNEIYLNSVNGKTVVEGDYAVLVKLAPGANIAHLDLLNDVNHIASISGSFVKGQNCTTKNSCACDDYINAQSVFINTTASSAYANTLPSYSGLVTCSGEISSCTPILHDSSGKAYQLVDPTGEAGVQKDGIKAQVWASLDIGDTISADNLPINGTLYVAKATILP